MKRKILFLGVIMLSFIGIAINILSNNNNNNENKIKDKKTLLPSPTNPPIKKDPMSDWITYNSTSSGFSIRYPKDISHEFNDEGETFTKLGPTQKTDAKFNDGIKIAIKSGDLKGLSFKAFVDKRYREISNDPSKPILGGKIPMTIAGIQGIAFTVENLSKKIMIFLPKGDKKYLEIANFTANPNRGEQTYQLTVDDMLTSITYNN